MKNKQGGFTLIELLVVVAIVVLLAAVLFPVFRRVRERGRQVACLSNLRHLSLATFQYAMVCPNPRLELTKHDATLRQLRLRQPVVKARWR